MQLQTAFPANTLCVAVLLSNCFAAAPDVGIEQQIKFTGFYSAALTLDAGATVEISVGIASPSQLPDNGRVAVEWTAPDQNGSWRKVLHALDPDVFLVYRAPRKGRYTIAIRKVEDEAAIFNRPRWRETGIVSEVLRPFPRMTPWPAGHLVPVRVSIRPAHFGNAKLGTLVEMEPNNSIAQAQRLPLVASNDDQAFSVTGSSDDVEYFDNGMLGESGDDWFRLEYLGSQPRLLTVNLMPTDPFVSCRVRCYSPDGKEYTEGKHLNELPHEQVEDYRSAITRTVKPGGVYLLRVEANSPGYDLEARIRRPAPFIDPREAVRLAMGDHVAQVSAWLMNRPRGNNLDRRLRETGSLYGSNCMSCHTQSGVWGPAVPLAFGYRIENPLHYRHLINVMYESLRPTNVLKDAANNTSLPPHDLGDGPAGTRIAGHNVLTAEAVIAPRRLHSRQQIRTANYVLQTSDPTGINAAGNGSNVGQAVVIHYSAEILRRALDKTGEQRYRAGILDRAAAMLRIKPKYTDDLAHRVLFFRRVFPSDFASLQRGSPDAQKLLARVKQQLGDDERSLRSSQRADGGWGFSPGKVDAAADPSPTALAIDALVSLGAGREDPAVARGVKALLAMQHPYGLWNRSAKTGFVTTAYVMNTLSRLFPDSQPKVGRRDLEPAPGDSLCDAVGRMRMLARLAPWSIVSSDLPPEAHLDLMRAGAKSASRHVRCWAMIALGACQADASVAPLIAGLDDPVKMVREGARWGLRQALLDDRGWEQVFAAYEQGSDLKREQLAAALVMRANAAIPDGKLDLQRLAAVLDRMMNADASPAVRAWGVRAAWNWWVWNPSIRKPLNQAYIKLLESPEPSVLAENAKRYQLQALLIVNGNRASANYDNPYPELAELFQRLGTQLKSNATSSLLSERLTAVAATYYNASYGSNGPGQLGYATPHSSETLGKAVASYWANAERNSDLRAVRLAVEAAANIIDEGVQKKLLHYSIEGPKQLRPIAASSLSDPRAVLLPTTPEFVGPLMQQILADAQTAEGRRQASRRTFRQLAQARWSMSPSEGRQREFFQLLIPRLDDPSSDVQWFLADLLGRILAANPDFRTETLIAMVPKSFRNPAEESFWLPSAGWMLSHGAPLPQVGQSAFPENRPELRRFGLDLVLRNLAPGADRRLKAIAVSMLSQPALYSHPEIATAASQIDAGRMQSFLPQSFAREVSQAAAADMLEPRLELTPMRLRNVAYFRDFVLPELTVIDRADGNSCFSCHGGGKVPSMVLAAPDRRTGYLAAKDVWANYRTLLERVEFNRVESSKLLRKPLNIQTGKEDGHQGGMRYKPGDRTAEILLRWATDASRLK